MGCHREATLKKAQTEKRVPAKQCKTRNHFSSAPKWKAENKELLHIKEHFLIGGSMLCMESNTGSQTQNPENHDPSWDQASDAQQTEPPSTPRSDFKRKESKQTRWRITPRNWKWQSSQAWGPGQAKRTSETQEVIIQKAGHYPWTVQWSRIQKSQVRHDEAGTKGSACVYYWERREWRELWNGTFGKCRRNKGTRVLDSASTLRGIRPSSTHWWWLQSGTSTVDSSFLGFLKTANTRARTEC